MALDADVLFADWHRHLLLGLDHLLVDVDSAFLNLALTHLELFLNDRHRDVIGPTRRPGGVGLTTEAGGVNHILGIAEAGRTRRHPGHIRDAVPALGSTSLFDTFMETVLSLTSVMVETGT